MVTKKFIRILWGSFDRYKNQIVEARKDNLNETVVVWGEDNANLLDELGYDCHLVSNSAYDPSISTDHTFKDHRSLIHKIEGLKIALDLLYDEIVFVDWDCRKVKEIDDNFWNLLRQKESKLQVPLYTYPKKAFNIMLEDTKREPHINNFIKKLKEYIEKYSFEYQTNHIIPNTGFMYCNDITIIDKLLEIIKANDLQTVPDELSVFLYGQHLGLNQFIKEIDPLVIGGKVHGYEWWNNIEDSFDKYKASFGNKTNYFIHY